MADNNEAKGKGEGSSGISWLSVLPYIVIVLLGMTLAYIGGGYGGMTLDKQCAVDRTKWAECEESLKYLAREANDHETDIKKYIKLQKDCAVDRTKWDDCKKNNLKCVSDISELNKKIDSFEKKMDEKDTELTKLKVDCVKDKVLLGVKDGDEKKQMDIKRDFDDNMQKQKVLEGAQKQKIDDMTKEITQLRNENEKLNQKMRRMVAEEEERSRREQKQNNAQATTGG